MAAHVIIWHPRSGGDACQVVPDDAALCDRLAHLYRQRLAAEAFRALRPGSTAHDQDDQTGGVGQDEDTGRWMWWGEAPDEAECP